MRYDNYLPNILNTVGEGTIVRELNDHAIDYVVIVHRTAYEHGYPLFGIDYGSHIKEWINTNYELVTVIGDMPFSTGAMFGTAIYKKKNAIWLINGDKTHEHTLLGIDIKSTLRFIT